MESTTLPQQTQRVETLVFVYGTLLCGQSNHRFLDGARCLGEARTAPEFDLVDLGGFPALVKGGCTSVRGEVYACDSTTLRALDELEDHPEFFQRTRIRLEDGALIECYVLPAVQASCFPRIPSGDWREMRRAS